MSALKHTDDNPPDVRPPATTPGDHPPGAEEPPRGVATMAIVRWVLVAIAAIVAVVSIASYSGVHLGGGKTTTSSSESQLYTCPMHPSIVQDHPGQCPICSMTLVPKLARDKATSRGKRGARAAGLSPVDLPPRSGSSSSGCRRRPSHAEAIGGELRTVGVVAANERGPGADHDPLRRLDPEAAGVRDRRACPPRTGAGHHL